MQNCNEEKIITLKMSVNNDQNYTSRVVKIDPVSRLQLIKAKQNMNKPLKEHTPSSDILLKYKSISDKINDLVMNKTKRAANENKIVKHKKPSASIKINKDAFVYDIGKYEVPSNKQKQVLMNNVIVKDNNIIIDNINDESLKINISNIINREIEKSTQRSKLSIAGDSSPATTLNKQGNTFATPVSKLINVNPVETNVSILAGKTGGLDETDIKNEEQPRQKRTRTGITKTTTLLNASSGSKATSGFSFGDTKASPDLENLTSGLKQDELSKPSAAKLKFAFGTTEKKDETKPAFAFGSAAEKKDETKPAFAFGSAAEKKDETKPAFAFGSAAEKKAESKPAFSFGAAAEKQSDSKPAFAFDSNVEKKDDSKPSFAFGATTEKKDETKSPFAFGTTAEKKDEPKPAFAFGNTEKKDETKSAFSFGASEKKDEAKPSFTFGATAEKKDDSKPAFAFGATEKKDETKPASRFDPGPKAVAPSVVKPVSRFDPTPVQNSSSKVPSDSKASAFGMPAVAPNIAQSSSKSVFQVGKDTSSLAPKTSSAFSFGSQSKDGESNKVDFKFGTGSLPTAASKNNQTAFNLVGNTGVPSSSDSKKTFGIFPSANGKSSFNMGQPGNANFNSMVPQGLNSAFTLGGSNAASNTMNSAFGAAGAVGSNPPVNNMAQPNPALHKPVTGFNFGGNAANPSSQLNFNLSSNFKSSTPPVPQMGSNLQQTTSFNPSANLNFSFSNNNASNTGTPFANSVSPQLQTQQATQNMMFGGFNQQSNINPAGGAPVGRRIAKLRRR